MSIVLDAAKYAAECHKNQRRKWTLRPYIEHPMRVAGRITLAYCPISTLHHEQLIAVGWLHDVIEDCGVTCNDVESRFGPEVACRVQALTNVSKSVVNANRAERKKLDQARLAACDYWTRRIKLMDRNDNLLEMSAAEEGMRRLYARETLDLLYAIVDPDDAMLLTLVMETLSLIKDTHWLADTIYKRANVENVYELLRDAREIPSISA